MDVALQCRRGDILKVAIDYHLLPHIVYKDVYIRFVGGVLACKLEAKVTIRNAKGGK